MKLITLALTLTVVGIVGTLLAEELSQRDQLHIQVQQICPVSGLKLGQHGTPLKTKLGDETLFLCCGGCVDKQVNPEHWATIHANFAKAQGTCPIMKKPLPDNPRWTIVEGQIIYVCCPPCIEKIAANPAAAIKAVDELYANSIPQDR